MSLFQRRTRFDEALAVREGRQPLSTPGRVVAKALDGVVEARVLGVWLEPNAQRAARVTVVLDTQAEVARVRGGGKLPSDAERVILGALMQQLDPEGPTTVVRLEALESWVLPRLYGKLAPTLNDVLPQAFPGLGVHKVAAVDDALVVFVGSQADVERLEGSAEARGVVDWMTAYVRRHEPWGYLEDGELSVVFESREVGIREVGGRLYRVRA